MFSNSINNLLCHDRGYLNYWTHCISIHDVKRHCLFGDDLRIAKGRDCKLSATLCKHIATIWQSCKTCHHSASNVAGLGCPMWNPYSGVVAHLEGQNKNKNGESLRKIRKNDRNLRKMRKVGTLAHLVLWGWLHPWIHTHPVQDYHNHSTRTRVDFQMYWKIEQLYLKGLVEETKSKLKIYATIFNLWYSFTLIFLFLFTFAILYYI